MPGRVLYYYVELRSWSHVGHLETRAETSVAYPGTAAMLHALSAGHVYYPVVSACNALGCGIAARGAATLALQRPSQPIFEKMVRRSLAEILVGWLAPVDVGDGSGYLPGMHQDLAFTLEILNPETSSGLTVVSAANQV